MGSGHHLSESLRRLVRQTCGLYKSSPWAVFFQLLSAGCNKIPLPSHGLYQLACITDDRQQPTMCCFSNYSDYYDDESTYSLP